MILFKPFIFTLEEDDSSYFAVVPVPAGHTVDGISVNDNNEVFDLKIKSGLAITNSLLFYELSSLKFNSQGITRFVTLRTIVDNNDEKEIVSVEVRDGDGIGDG